MRAAHGVRCPQCRGPVQVGLDPDPEFVGWASCLDQDHCAWSGDSDEVDDGYPRDTTPPAPNRGDPMTTLTWRAVEDRRVATVTVIGAPLLGDERYVSPPLAVESVTVAASRHDGGPWQVRSIAVIGTNAENVDVTARRTYHAADGSYTYQLTDAPAWLRELADRALLDDVAARS